MKIRGLRQSVVSLLWNSEPDDGPVCIWVGDDRHAAFIDPVDGRLYAYIGLDDATTSRVTLFVPLCHGLHVIRHFNGYLVSLRRFPYAAIELGPYTMVSLREAQSMAEKLLQLG